MLPVEAWGHIGFLGIEIDAHQVSYVGGESRMVIVRDGAPCHPSCPRCNDLRGLK